MLVKFKPYLICDTLVNNCPRRALAVFTCHQGLGGGGGVLQGVARKVAATATPFPGCSYTIFTNFNKDKAQTGDEAGDEAAAAALAAILSNSISWLRQRRTSTGNRKAVTPFSPLLPL